MIVNYAFNNIVDAIFCLMTWQLPIRLSVCNLQQSKGPPGVGQRNLLRRPSQLRERERGMHTY
jgi:hypothetical protein